MLGIILTILYVAVSIFLILVVLLQTGKRADLAGAFGGGGSQTAFGTRGAATLLSKATTVSAVLFMLLALVLSILSSKRTGSGGSVLDEVQPADTPPPASAPATPGPIEPEGGASPLPPGSPATDTGDEGAAAEGATGEPLAREAGGEQP